MIQTSCSHSRPRVSKARRRDDIPYRDVWAAYHSSCFCKWYV